jgi:hypothetical protein
MVCFGGPYEPRMDAQNSGFVCRHQKVRRVYRPEVFEVCLGEIRQQRLQAKASQFYLWDLRYGRIPHSIGCWVLMLIHLQLPSIGV